MSSVAFLWSSKCNKMVDGWGFALHPTVELTALPRLLSGVQGGLLIRPILLRERGRLERKIMKAPK